MYYIIATKDPIDSMQNLKLTMESFHLDFTDINFEYLHDTPSQEFGSNIFKYQLHIHLGKQLAEANHENRIKKLERQYESHNTSVT